MPATTEAPAFIRGLDLLFGRKHPWRKSFLLLRTADARRHLPGFEKLADRLWRKFEITMESRPDAIAPFLTWVRQTRGNDAANELADLYASEPGVSTPRLVGLAKYHYAHSHFSRGDALLDTAKAQDPDDISIYEEEAWNQRARGNLHREIQAVVRCIRLSRTANEQLEWEIWLGHALVRQEQFDEAWTYLKRFPQLPVRDERALTAAYCAQKRGDEDQTQAAYAHAAPSSHDDFDLISAAEGQLSIYHRADEAERLLESTDTSAPTRLLELSYTANLRLGHVEKATASLREANTRSDASDWVQRTYAQLLELLGRPDDALRQYLAMSDTDFTPFLRYRAACLLSEMGKREEAVQLALSGTHAPSKLPPTKLEVDPRLSKLQAQFSRRASAQERIGLLRRIVAAASEIPLITASGYLLAEAYAEERDWNRAWNAIQAAQAERLPAISLGTDPAKEPGLSSRTLYFEATEADPLAIDTVLYESSLGDATACNPLAICLELLADPSRQHLQHVWSVTPDAAIHPALLNNPNVYFVRKGSPGHLRHLATAKYIINNSTFESVFTKRPEQRVLSTWHGVPWKTLGKDNLGEPFAYGNIARTFLNSDIVISPDPHTEDVLSRGMDVDLLAPEIFRRMGYPRNDLAVNLTSTKRASIRAELGVEDSQKLVLLMPTWKGLFAHRDAEVDEVLDTAKGLSGDGHVVALRAHHYVREAFGTSTPPEGVTLIPEQFDTNELLGAADVLVTDFSSVLFDAAAVGVPVVKLVHDINEYSSQRGLYFSPSEIPGANAASLKEAREHIASAFNDASAFIDSYRDKTRRFSSEERGSSSQDAIAALFSDTHHHGASLSEKKPLLISTGGLPPNGITRAARSILGALEATDYVPFLFPTANTLEGATPETRNDIRDFARLLPFVGTPAGTRMEHEALRFYSSSRYIDFPFVNTLLRSGRRREAGRQFGKATFHSAVEYSGYDARNTALVAYGVKVDGSGKRGLIFHNEMYKEVRNRFPRLQSQMRILDDFDFLGSVSYGVMEYNRDSLFEHFGTPKKLHITTENIINVREIEDVSLEPLADEDREWYESPGAHACVVARLSPEKNHSQLLEALAECREALPQPVKLTFLGDGPLRLELEHQVTSLGLEDLVRLRGLVANPHSHLKHVDAMFLPSLHEGQPLVILEALTVGTPVVATETPGSRSVLEDGKLGSLVSMNTEGLIEGLQRIATGDLLSASNFDPAAFSRRSLQMFTDALEYGSANADV